MILYIIAALFTALREYPYWLLFVQQKNTYKNSPDHLLSEEFFDADDGTRTHTMLPPADFESAASANSATSA